MTKNSALIPGMVQWTMTQKNRISCNFGCGYLFLDVCGFTKLTEQVSAKGHYGVEVITNLLNQYFDLLNAKVTKYGGQILKFEGDAVLAAFPLSPEICIAQIQLCTQEFNAALDTLNIDLMKEYGSSLAYHGSIGFGLSQMIILGNPEIHLDYFVYSPVMAELYLLCENAGHNESLAVDFTDEDILISSRSCQLSDLNQIPQYAQKNLDKSFLPEQILERGESDTFTGELRNSAILFIGVNSEEFIQSGDFATVNSYFCAIQEIVFRLEGMVNKIDYTDKGMILLISFGVLHTHVDDIERAILCAYQINRIVSPLKAKIGVTYSNLYAGILGAKLRHEYGIIGGGVNVAARLMSSAEYGQIVITKDILASAESRFEAKFLRKTKVKGIKEELEFFLIVRELPEYVNSYSKQFNDKQLVSYKKEMEVIQAGIEAKKLNQVIIYGEHGTGKSFLGWQVLKKQYDTGSKIGVFVMDEYNRHDRLILLNKLICKGMNCEDPLSNEKKLRSYLETLLETREMDLLLQALGIGSLAPVFEDGGRNRDLLLISLLKSFETLMQKHEFVLIDNCHWMDELSLQIVQKRIDDKARRSPLLILTSAPLHSKEEEEIHTVIAGDEQNSRTAVLELTDLAHKNVYDLIRSRVPNITHQAGEYIYNLAGGNPRFIVELCTQISTYFPDPDMLITATNIQEIQNKGLLPYSVENLFMMKYETLSTDAKEILKKASIIGQGFTLKEITETQENVNLQEISSVLSELKDKDIIDITDLAPEVQYLFSNVLMRQAVYSTILLKEKRDLHNRIAVFYEAKFGERADQKCELLAYHYHLGENFPKALYFALLAAKQNQAISNHGEAIHYYQIALQSSSESTEQADIKLGIVDSQFYLGMMEEAISILDEIDLARVTGMQTTAKYHFLRTRSFYLRGEYEELLAYLEKVSDFAGKWGEQIRLYQLDTLYKLFRMDELTTLKQQLKKQWISMAAKALNTKATKPENLLERYNALAEEAKTEEQKRYLFLVLKAESIDVTYLTDTGRYSEAREVLLKQYEFAKALKDDLSLRIAAGGLGVVYTRMGNLDKAYKHLVDAIGIADRIGDRFGFAKVMYDLGTLHRRMGDHTKAMQNFKRSQKIFETMGHLSLQGMVQHGMGELLHWEEKYKQAEKHYRKALKLAKLSGDVVGISYEQDAIGDILYLTGFIPQAKRLYQKNLKHQEQIGDREGIAHTYGNLGNVAKTEKNYPLAIEYYHKNIDLTAEVGDTDGNGRGYYNLASIYEDLNDRNKAHELLKIALERFETAGSTQFIGMTKKRLEAYQKG